MLERLKSWGTEADLFSLFEAGLDSALLIDRDGLVQASVQLRRQEPLILLLHHLSVPAHLIKTGPVVQAIQYIGETRAANVTVEQVADEVLEIEVWLFEEDLSRTALNIAFSEVMVVRRILTKRLEALGVRGENGSHSSSHRSASHSSSGGMRRARRTGVFQPTPVPSEKPPSVSLADESVLSEPPRTVPQPVAPVAEESVPATSEDPPAVSRIVGETLVPDEPPSGSEVADEPPSTIPEPEPEPEAQPEPQPEPEPEPVAVEPARIFQDELPPPVFKKAAAPPPDADDDAPPSFDPFARPGRKAAAGTAHPTVYGAPRPAGLFGMNVISDVSYSSPMPPMEPTEPVNTTPPPPPRVEEEPAPTPRAPVRARVLAAPPPPLNSKPNGGETVKPCPGCGMQLKPGADVCEGCGTWL